MENGKGVISWQCGEKTKGMTTHPVNYKANDVFWQLRKQNAFWDSWAGRQSGGKNEYRGDWAQMNMRVVVVEEDAIEEKHVKRTDDGPSVWD